MGVNSNRVDNFSDNENETNSQPQTVIRVESLPLPLPHREVHRVSMAPNRTTLQKLKQRLGDIFFPDDPLHRFKNQTWVRKFVLGLQYFFPIFQWAPEYGLGPFRSDLVSGITIASLAIPQGISYAKLANLPPIVGLCQYQFLDTFSYIMQFTKS